MLAKEYRARAKESLKGQWNLMALIALIEGLLVGALNLAVIGDILVGGPIWIGVTGCALKVSRGNQVKIENMFDGFGNFVKSFLLYLLNGLLIFLWSLLLIIPGIIKAYSYAMSPYILNDNPEMEVNDVRKESMKMMDGHKWQLFCLHFSFIGWILLSILTLGILLLWVAPYMKVATAKFYDNLKAAKPVENA